MKTKKILTMAALALTFAACGNDDSDMTAPQPAEAHGMITVTAKLAPKDVGTTRAVQDNGDNKITATWAVNEELRIIAAKESSSFEHEATATVTAVDGDGAATITFNIDDAARGRKCFIIYPYDAAVTETDGVYTADPITAQTGVLNTSLDVRIGAGTIQDNGTLDVITQPAAQFAIFKFTVKNPDTSATINVKSLTVTIGSQDHVITPASATSTLYAALPAVSSQSVGFSATDSDGKTYFCAKDGVTFSAGNYYQSTLRMPQYVLMGDGLKWAACNLGATNPWDYGEYYSWGATATQTIYDWDNYPHMQAGQSGWDYINKYTFADGQTRGIWYDGDGNFIGDNKTSLADYDYADDAARQRWGGTWRVPTNDEWAALRNTDNYSWVWTDDYLGDGSNHAGMVVTCVNGSCAGNSIFLPNAGYYQDAIFFHVGFYWSSSLDTGTNKMSDYACGVQFDHNGVLQAFGSRRVGLPIRAVAE